MDGTTAILLVTVLFVILVGGNLAIPILVWVGRRFSSKPLTFRQAAAHWFALYGNLGR